jgi:hypothetical protein
MREKILAQLVTKYPGVSKQALGLIADKLAKKVTEESGIEQSITDFDNAVSITEYAAELQREGDRRVGDAKKEWEKKKPKPAAGNDKTETNTDDPPPSGDDAPAWAKTLMQQVQTLTAEKMQGSIKSKVAEKLKDKVPEKFYGKWALPSKEEDIETFVSTVEKDWTDFKQEQVNAGLMSATPPAGGGGSGGSKGGPGDAKVDADIKAWGEKNKKKADVINKQSQTT